MNEKIKNIIENENRDELLEKIFLNHSVEIEYGNKKIDIEITAVKYWEKDNKKRIYLHTSTFQNCTVYIVLEGKYYNRNTIETESEFGTVVIDGYHGSHAKTQNHKYGIMDLIEAAEKELSKIENENANESSDTQERIKKNGQINKSNLFKKAWGIARELAHDLLISVKAAFSAALKIAWQQAR